MRNVEIGSKLRMMGITGGSALVGAALTYGLVRMENNIEPIPQAEMHQSNDTLRILHAQESLVRITTTFKIDDATQNPTLQCNGFIIRNKSGIPYIISAYHCLPSEIKGPDGKIYPTISNDGTSMLNPIAQNKNGERYTINSFVSLVSSNNPDISLLKLSEGQRVKEYGIEVSQEEAKKGEIVTLMRTDQDFTYKYFSLQIVNNDENGKLTLLSIEDAQNGCIQGASGSPIIDSKGKLIGILSSKAESDRVIDQSYALKHSLDRSLIGRTARECFAVDAQTLSSLVNNR